MLKERWKGYGDLNGIIIFALKRMVMRTFLNRSVNYIRELDKWENDVSTTFGGFALNDFFSVNYGSTFRCAKALCDNEAVK